MCHIFFKISLFLCQDFDIDSVLLFKRLFWLAYAPVYICQAKVTTSCGTPVWCCIRSDAQFKVFRLKSV